MRTGVAALHRGVDSLREKAGRRQPDDASRLLVVYETLECFEVLDADVAGASLEDAHLAQLRDGAGNQFAGGIDTAGNIYRDCQPFYTTTYAQQIGTKWVR